MDLYALHQYAELLTAWYQQMSLGNGLKGTKSFLGVTMRIMRQGKPPTTKRIKLCKRLSKPIFDHESLVRRVALVNPSSCLQYYMILEE